MPVELVHTGIALTFVAVCAMAGEILIRQRRGEGGLPPPRERLDWGGSRPWRPSGANAPAGGKTAARYGGPE
jgi:hypothetical protein